MNVLVGEALEPRQDRPKALLEPEPEDGRRDWPVRTVTWWPSSVWQLSDAADIAGKPNLFISSQVCNRSSATNHRCVTVT